MEALFGLMTILVPIITGLTSLAKEYVNKKYYALIPLIIGVAISPLALVLPFINASLGEIMWAGLLSGLSAGGFYSVQNIRNKEAE